MLVKAKYKSGHVTQASSGEHELAHYVRKSAKSANVFAKFKKAADKVGVT